MNKKIHTLAKPGLFFLVVATAGFGPNRVNDENGMIAFTVSELHQPDQVCTFDLNNSNINCLTGDNWPTVANPLWSPDGRYIAFTAFQEGYGEIYVMDADGSNQIQLTHAQNPIAYPIPEWLPDSKWLYYGLVDKDLVSTEYMVTVDGTEKCTLFDSAIQEGIVRSDCPQAPESQLVALYQNHNLNCFVS